MASSPNVGIAPAAQLRYLYAHEENRFLPSDALKLPTPMSNITEAQTEHKYQRVSFEYHNTGREQRVRVRY